MTDEFTIEVSSTANPTKLPNPDRGLNVETDVGVGRSAISSNKSSYKSTIANSKNPFNIPNSKSKSEKL